MFWRSFQDRKFGTFDIKNVICISQAARLKVNYDPDLLIAFLHKKKNFW